MHHLLSTYFSFLWLSSFFFLKLFCHLNLKVPIESIHEKSCGWDFHEKCFFHCFSQVSYIHAFSASYYVSPAPQICANQLVSRRLFLLFSSKNSMLPRVQHLEKNKSSSLLLSHILLTKFVFLYITVNWVLSVIYPPSDTKRICFFSEILSRCGVINLLISCHIPTYFGFYASCLSALYGTIAFPKNICSPTFLADRSIFCLIVFAGSIS